jgi:hypothetical protein
VEGARSGNTQRERAMILRVTSPPSQVVPPEFVLFSFLGNFSDLPVSFDRILTESVNKLTES